MSLLAMLGALVTLCKPRCLQPLPVMSLLTMLAALVTLCKLRCSLCL